MDDFGPFKCPPGTPGVWCPFAGIPIIPWMPGLKPLGVDFCPNPPCQIQVQFEQGDSATTIPTEIVQMELVGAARYQQISGDTGAVPSYWSDGENIRVRDGAIVFDLTSLPNDTDVIGFSTVVRTLSDLDSSVQLEIYSLGLKSFEVVLVDPCSEGTLETTPFNPRGVASSGSTNHPDSIILWGSEFMFDDELAMFLLLVGEGDCLIQLPGDVNVSGSVTSADIIQLVGYIFKGGAPPLPCVANGDVNCDGSVTSADIIWLVGFVFKGGAPPCDICNDSPLPCQ